MKRPFGAAVAALTMLLCPPFVDVALAQFFDVTRVSQSDWTCAKDDGTPISGHQRENTAREACERYSLANGLAPFRLIGGDYRFVATAAAQPPRPGVPPINVDDDPVLPPVWRVDLPNNPMPSPIQFEEGVGGTLDLNDYCYSPSGAARTISAVGTPPTGITIPSGVLTVSVAAVGGTSEVQAQCDDGSGIVTISLPIEIIIVSDELREMGYLVSEVTISESATYSLGIGRANTLFPSALFAEEWTADVNVSGCGITPTEEQITLLAYPGSGPTLSYGYIYYVIDPPAIAANCDMTVLLDNFANVTSPGSPPVAAAITSLTVHVTNEVDPGGGGVFFTSSTLQPPTLVTPTTYDTKAELAAACQETKTVGIGITGPGIIYECDQGTSTTDLLIDLSQEDAASKLTYPLHVSNYRNVIIRGVHIEPEVQAGNDVNDLPGRVCSPTCVDAPNSNPRPRVPYGGGAIRVNNYGHTFIEGVHVNLQGHNGDVIIWRTAYNTWNSSTPTANQRAALILTVQNSRFEGREGQAGNNSLHADSVHTQGNSTDQDGAAQIRFENVTDISGQEGAVILGWGGWACMTFRNFSYERSAQWDLPNDDNNGGAPIAENGATYPGCFSIENFYYNNGNGYNVGIYRTVGAHIGASNCGSTSGLIVNSEMSCTIPGTALAPADKVGRFYVTPH